MITTLQRSITFPPIRLKKIDDYVIYITTHEVSLEELKERGFDIGKGKGDITRFLERLKIVEVLNGSVRLTALGRRFVTLKEILGLSIYHALFFQRVPQYRLLVEILKEVREVRREDLYNLVNDRISKISPTAWVNKVAFKTLLQIAEDLNVAKRNGNIYSFLEDPVERSVIEYYKRYGVKIGQSFYVRPDAVIIKECGKEEPPYGLYRVDAVCTVSNIYNIFTE